MPTHYVSTGPLSTLLEKSDSNISGTTFYFVRQCKLIETYIYKKQKDCSERIIHSSNIIAIQTLQFQRRKRYLKGSTLMVSNSNDDSYKLFFVSSYVEHYNGIMYGYFFNGVNPTMSPLVKLCLNNVMDKKRIYWVNIVNFGDYFHSVNIIDHDASIVNDYVVGKNCPTSICLPPHQPNVEFNYQFRNYEEAPTSKQSSNNRRSSRTRKLFQTDYNLNTKYLTIFITKSYEVPYQSWVDENDFTIFVPYFKSEKKIKNSVFQTIKYGVIFRDELPLLHNTHFIHFNSRLEALEKGNFELVQPIKECAIRFCILPNKEFNQYYNEKHACIYNLDKKFNILNGKFFFVNHILC